MSWAELHEPTTMAFFPLPSSRAPGNSDEWQILWPAKFSMPLNCGMFFLPEWPVAWMMCLGWNVLSSAVPSAARLLTVTVQTLWASSHLVETRSVRVQTLSSRRVA